MLTTVSAVTARIVRRTRDSPRSMTGQSAVADGSRRSARRCIQAPKGISSRPLTKMAGRATKTTRPA